MPLLRATLKTHFIQKTKIMNITQSDCLLYLFPSKRKVKPKEVHEKDYLIKVLTNGNTDRVVTRTTVLDYQVLQHQKKSPRWQAFEWLELFF